MTAEHFTELIGTICETKKIKVRHIADMLGVSSQSVRNWKRDGIPIARSVRAYQILREYCMEE